MKGLLLKYINGNCTDREKVKITNWLDSDPQNMKEYIALRKLSDISIWQISPTAESQQKQKTKFLMWNKNKVYLEVLKFAAIFIIAFLAFHHFTPELIDQNKITKKMQILHVPAGQRAEITLEDGSKVWLNAKSTLTFPSQFSKQYREVKLDGEGFFDIAHNKEKAFIVNTRKYDVKVWGTKFNLIAYSENESFDASLLEGSVEVMKQGNSKGFMLKPNEQVHMKNDRIVISQIDNLDYFLWREGIISFDNATFSELINKLELYFDLTIEVENNKVLNYRYTGKFRMKDGVEHILTVLQLKNSFEYRIDEKLNRITIE